MYFLGICESADEVEVPKLLLKCLEEDDTTIHCALLKKVFIFFFSFLMLPSTLSYKYFVKVSFDI